MRRFDRLSLLVCLLTVVALEATPAAAEEKPAELVPGTARDLIDSSSTRARDLEDNSGGLFPVVPEEYREELLSPETLGQQPARPPEGEDEEGELIEEVDVKGTRRRQKPKELVETGTKFTIDRQTIDDVQARTVADVLQTVPGITVINSLGGVNSEFSTYVRGLDTRRILFAVDGRPVLRGTDNRAADIGRLPTVNVERIEVVTGGAALSYSADAIAGAINVITAVPEGPPKLKLKVDAGSYGFSQYLGNVSGSNGVPKTNAGFLGFDVGYERRSALNNYSGFFYQAPVGAGISAPGALGAQFPGPRAGVSQLLQFPINIPRTLQAGYTFNDFYFGKLIWKPAIKHTLTLDVTQLNSRLGDQFALPNVFGGCQIVNPRVDEPRTTLQEQLGFAECTSAQNGLGRGDQAQDETGMRLAWDWNVGANDLLSTTLSLNTAFYTYPSSPTPYVSTRAFDAQVRYTGKPFREVDLNAGLQFTTQRYTATPIIGIGPQGFQPSGSAVPIFLADREYWRASAFVSGDFKSYDRAFTLSLGARFIQEQQFGGYVAAGVGARYNFGGPSGSEPISLRASWQRGVKAPGLAQLFGYGATGSLNQSGGGSNAAYLPNPLLVPETGVSYDVGVDYTPTDNLQVRLTYFRIDLSQPLLDNVPLGNFSLLFPGADPAGTTQLFSTLNTQGYSSQGVEFSVDWRLSREWNLRLAHTITDARAVGDPRNDVFTFPAGAILGPGEAPPEDCFIPNQAIPTGVPFSAPTCARVPSPGVFSGYYYGYPAFDVPFNQTQITIGYRSPGGFRAALIGQLVGLRPRLVGPNYWPPYGKWDFTFGFPIASNITFTGGVFNIFNDQSVLADGSLRIGGGILSPPTTFRFGIEATLGGPPAVTR